MLGDLRLVRPAEYAAFANEDSVRTRESYLRRLPDRPAIARS
jgi:hypothetical protein